jgi:hypothetical protein
MLAQAWLYGERARTRYDKVLEAHLTIPDKFNPFSSVAVLNNIAERIVFTDDVPTLLYSLWDNKQLSFHSMINSAKLPYDCFWIEYSTKMGVVPDDDIKRGMYGALIKRTGNTQDGAVKMYIVAGIEDSNKFASTIAYVCNFDRWPPLVNSERFKGRSALQFDVEYAFNIRENMRDYAGAIDELGSIVSELIFGIFLVTQPKIYKEERVEWHPKKQAARKKSNKPPLLEYRRIRMRVLTPATRYVPSKIRPQISEGETLLDTESEAAKQHRRYHNVSHGSLPTL